MLRALAQHVVGRLRRDARKPHGACLVGCAILDEVGQLVQQSRRGSVRALQHKQAEHLLEAPLQRARRQARLLLPQHLALLRHTREPRVRRASLVAHAQLRARRRLCLLGAQGRCLLLGEANELAV